MKQRTATEAQRGGAATKLEDGSAASLARVHSPQPWKPPLVREAAQRGLDAQSGREVDTAPHPE